MIRDDLRYPSSIRVGVTDSITAKVLLSSSYPNSKKIWGQKVPAVLSFPRHGYWFVMQGKMMLSALSIFRCD